MTSSPTDLTARLRRRLETEHQQIEETAANELRRFGESLSAVVNDALCTIEGRYGGGDRTAERPPDARVAPAHGARPEPCSRYLRRELGGDALAVDEHRTPDRDVGGAQREHRAGPRDAVLHENPPEGTTRCPRTPSLRTVPWPIQ